MPHQSHAVRLRRFLVKSRDDAGHCRGVLAAGFEDAALQCIETWRSDADEDPTVSVIVEDEQSGERHCFTIDLGHGEARPCGA